MDIDREVVGMIYHKDGIAWTTVCYGCYELTDFGKSVYTEKETGAAYCVKCAALKAASPSPAAGTLDQT